MEKKTSLVPLQFIPAEKERIWGGTQWPHRTSGKTIGEYWYIYDRPGESGVVDGGPFAGWSLHDLLKIYGEDLVGQGHSCEYFPVMIKVLDAGQNLSLQVHSQRNEKKDEFWYILGAHHGTKMIAGMIPGARPEDLWDNLRDYEKLRPHLLLYHPRKGNGYFIKSGCMHALCAGSLVLEIQENSDTTYRISDWGRRTPEGKFRDLHVQESKANLDFGMSIQQLPTGTALEDCQILQGQTSFAIRKLAVRGKRTLSTADDGCFHILSAVGGPLRLQYGDTMYDVPDGHTFLIPASCGEYTLFAADLATSALLTTAETPRKRV